jgi:signal transduction histidine kinase
MTLRQRTLFVVILVLVAAIAIIYLLVNDLLMASYAALEEQFLESNVRRATNAIDDIVKNLDITAKDYAGWDDTYAFAQDGNQQYIETNYSNETFANLGVNYLVITNETGDPLFYKAYDTENEAESPFAADLLAALTGDSIFQQVAEDRDSVRGVLLLAGQDAPIILASHPVLTSMNEGPVRGALIMGRLLNEAEIGRLNELTAIDFTIYQTGGDNDALPADARAALSFLLEAPETAVYTLALDEKTAVGYSLIEDVYAQPGLLVHVDQAREIYQQGLVSMRLTLAALVSVGAVLCVVVIIALDRLVLRRLTTLSATVAAVSASGDLSLRIPAQGHDELARLATDINQMFASLDKTQRDLAQAKDKAEEATQIKSQFITMVTHELRVPLTSIHGFADLLLGPMGGPLTENQQKLLKPIHQNAIRMDRLIKDLSDLEQIESGRLHLLIQNISLLGAVLEATSLLQANIEKKEQTLRLEVADNLPLVKADGNRLVQILLNLISNAHKYSSTGGTITIRATLITEGDTPLMQVAVSDTGYGIRPEDQAKLFSQFFRASDDQIRQEVGTGLGLYITRLMVEMQNGRIWFESTYQQGTTFYFTLPTVS